MKLIKLEALFKYSSDIQLRISSETIQRLYVSLIRILEVKNDKITLIKESIDFNQQHLKIEKENKENLVSILILK